MGWAVGCVSVWGEGRYVLIYMLVLLTDEVLKSKNKQSLASCQLHFVTHTCRISVYLTECGVTSSWFLIILKSCDLLNVETVFRHSVVWW